MSGLKTWRNGEKAENVKKIIEENFKIVSRHLHHNILCLSTIERENLGSDYLVDGLIVFDTDLKGWFEYRNNKWSEYSLGAIYTYSSTFTSADWNNNIITIPYSTHLIPDPNVSLYILYDSTYQSTIGGVSIDSEHNVILSTDLPFEGKVVIK